MSHLLTNRFSSSFATGVVVALWFLMSVIVLFFVSQYATPYPFSDEWHLIPVAAGEEPFSLDWIWARHGDHQIPVPKFWMFSLLRVSDLDFRVLVGANALLAIVASCGFLAGLHSFRGRLAITDTFVPLSLLSLLHGSYSWGFHIQFLSSTAIMAFVLAVFLSRPLSTASGSIWWHELSLGVLLVLLALCGVNGAVPALVLGVGLFLHGLHWLLTHAVGIQRVQIGIRLLFCTIAVAFSGSALFPQALSEGGALASRSIVPVVTTSMHVLASPLGAFLAKLWVPISAALIGWIVLVLAPAQYARFRLQPVSREDMLGENRGLPWEFFIYFAAALAIPLAVGWGRGGREWTSGLSMHYSLLALPVYWAVYVLAFETRGFPRAALQYGLVLIFGLAAVRALPPAFDHGEVKKVTVIEINRDIVTGLDVEEIVNRHILSLFYIDTPHTRESVLRGLRLLQSSNSKLFESFGSTGNVDKNPPPGE